MSAIARPLALIVIAAAASATAAAQPIDPTAGASLYRQRCAACHDNPQGRIPPLQAIKALPRAEMVRAMTSGSMKEQAAGLDQPGIAAIADFLGGARADASRQSEAGLCEGAAPSIDLSAPAWNGWGRD